jgi:hypothetical protein
MGRGRSVGELASETGLPRALVELEIKRRFALREGRRHQRSPEPPIREGAERKKRIARKESRFVTRTGVRGKAARRAAEEVVELEDKMLARVRGAATKETAAAETLQARPAARPLGRGDSEARQESPT